MPHNYAIRSAKNEDSPEILQLILDIWTKEYSFDVSPADCPDLNAIQKYYLDKGGAFLVAHINNQIIGTVAYDKLGDNLFVLKRMFVRQGFRGKGVAQKLLDEILRQAGHEAIFYLSTKDNQAVAAKKFYLRNGFKIISKSELPANFPFFYKDDLFMRREGC